MSQYNLTKSGKTLAAILKEHNADKYFQFKDYIVAVADNNLIPGLETLFLFFEVPTVSTTVTQSFAKSTAKHPNQQTNVEVISRHYSSLT
jgi:hypothetical protein